MRLSDHFTLQEFVRSQTASRWGINNTPNQTIIDNLKELAKTMEEVRRALSNPITISSGYRSPELNRKIGGSMNSQHMTGQACDFTVKNMALDDIMDLIITSKISYDQLIKEYDDGKGGGWIHISITNVPRKMALMIDRTGIREYV